MEKGVKGRQELVIFDGRHLIIKLPKPQRIYRPSPSVFSKVFSMNAETQHRKDG